MYTNKCVHMACVGAGICIRVRIRVRVFVTGHHYPPFRYIASILPDRAYQ